jgi:hypothetical protein
MSKASYCADHQQEYRCGCGIVYRHSAGGFFRVSTAHAATEWHTDWLHREWKVRAGL